MVIARGWWGVGVNEEKLLHGYSVSLWGDKNDLGLDRGTSCTAL